MVASGASQVRAGTCQLQQVFVYRVVGSPVGAERLLTGVSPIRLRSQPSPYTPENYKEQKRCNYLRSLAVGPGKFILCAVGEGPECHPHVLLEHVLEFWDLAVGALLSIHPPVVVVLHMLVHGFVGFAESVPNLGVVHVRKNHAWKVRSLNF